MPRALAATSCLWMCIDNIPQTCYFLVFFKTILKKRAESQILPAVRAETKIVLMFGDTNNGSWEPFIA